MDQAYKDKVLRELYEKIWEYQNTVNESVADRDKLLGEVIYNATPYSAIVAGRIYELVEEAKKTV